MDSTINRRHSPSPSTLTTACSSACPQMVLESSVDGMHHMVPQINKIFNHTALNHQSLKGVQAVTLQRES